ncbi:DUF3239 domain-containing protein [Corynebacterium gottingense]|uniref:DUF3239 domain-containing protein n=1 Tax=Corynebacterium gottingense TaxID=2041036 RepID=UPI0038D21580
MSTFHFDVDEEYAKQHNELLRDTKSMVLSGIALFVLSIASGIAAWIFIDPTSPWRLLASVGLILFGVMMLIVALMLPKSVGKTQTLYDAHPLAPAIITENVGTTLTLTALVNMNASDRGPARWALTSRVVKRIPNTHDTVGTKVPVIAVGGQRSTRDKNTWQVITPMPIAWATPDTKEVSRARATIPQDQWQRLEKARKDSELVTAAKNTLVEL